MSYNEAIEIIDWFIEWRKGVYLSQKYTFNEITEALIIIRQHENRNLQEDS